ncbi:MAG: TIGR03435 family protein [Candidatus Acidiferrales bacterium]
MQRVGGVIRSRRNLLFRVCELLAVAVPVIFCLLGATQSRAQSQAASAAPSPPVFEYDVASIKINTSGSANITYQTPPDGFLALNIPLRELTKSAYRIQDNQISATQDSLMSERYDIDAKMDVSVAAELQKLTPDDRRLARRQMLQALLADRFKLIIHRETKELPVYMLVIAKGGPKLQETKAAAGAPNASAPPGRGGGASVRTSRTGTGPVTLTVLHCSGEALADLLSTHTGRPVLDKTGLASSYDFTLKFMPDDAQAQPPSGPAPLDLPPSLFTAIQDQLGLKLESGKGPVEIIVIDHVERPSGN